uniref:Putative histone-arginine methyltransferase 1.3 n=1 Tax=Rhizophora mucronata TaxID=61149 RepID=A0A2P2M001_RHIMU
MLKCGNSSPFRCQWILLFVLLTNFLALISSLLSLIHVQALVISETNIEGMIYNTILVIPTSGFVNFLVYGL